MRRALLALCLASMPAFAQEDVADLGDPDWSVREGAALRLLAIGRPALPLLDAASRSADLEAAHRATALAHRIRLTLADSKGIWEALVRGSPYQTMGLLDARFHLDLDEAPVVDWTEWPDDPVRHAVEISGRIVRFGSQRFEFDPSAGVLLDPERVPGRLDPVDWWERRFDRDSADPIQRREALWRWSQLDNKRNLAIFDPVDRHFQDPDEQVRAYAIVAAADPDDPAVVAGIREMLDDPAPIVRREAAYALERR